VHLLRRLRLPEFEREAWVRFIGALFGLAFAFVAAIFATAFRQSGNFMMSVLLASFSLLLAVSVGITTVPYLARRVAAARVREALDYDVTREGVAYIMLVLVIGIAAMNTGNNLLFIVVSAMLATIIASGIASAIDLHSVALQVSMPDYAFAGRTLLTRVTLHNERAFLPVFSVSVVPPKRQQARAHRRWVVGEFVFPPRSWTGNPWVRWRDLQWRKIEDRPLDPPIFHGKAYFPYIAPRATATADVELTFPRRGRYQQEGLGLATKFPFSFLVKTRTVPLERELIVFPRVEATDAMLDVLPLITGEFETFVRGRGYDLYRIREYADGDSARHVDWKATAKSGALKVREFTREDERKLRIVFDNPAPGRVKAEAYERAIDLAASLAWHFAAEDTELTFTGSGYAGGHDVYDFLAYLALVEPKDGASIVSSLTVTDDYNIILTTQPRGSIPTQLWATSYFIFIED
jgi:uncharacterized protein (DUF58 family)